MGLSKPALWEPSTVGPMVMRIMLWAINVTSKCLSNPMPSWDPEVGALVTLVC